MLNSFLIRNDVVQPVLKMSWKVKLSVVIVIGILYQIYLVREESGDYDVLKSMEESGYVGELHHTVTEDGYILGVHRVVSKINVTAKSKTEADRRKVPVLLVHGLESLGLDWIFYHRNNSLPYLLYEKGYDVWLGNTRGTPSSYNHTTLDPTRDSKEFWNSSFHEVGYYDLPATIDYILNTTGHKQLFYIGMSQGEATFLVLTSMRPEYNEKIRLASMTAPSAFLKHSDNLFFKSLGMVWPLLQNTFQFLGIHNVPFRSFLGSFCQYKVMSTMCLELSAPSIGYFSDFEDKHEAITKFFKIYPINSAFKQFLHYAQVFNSGIFRMYDYGKEGNLRMYSNVTPTEYDLGKITAPIAYYWAENDCWSRPKDIEEVIAKLPNVVLNYQIPHPKFNHMDVMITSKAKELLYDKIIEVMEKS